ncbi:MAG: hypothetical protein WC763_06600, partial [Candidatus Paceibacterota bacterium]
MSRLRTLGDITEQVWCTYLTRMLYNLGPLAVANLAAVGSNRLRLAARTINSNDDRSIRLTIDATRHHPSSPGGSVPHLLIFPSRMFQHLVSLELRTLSNVMVTTTSNNDIGNVVVAAATECTLPSLRRLALHFLGAIELIASGQWHLPSHLLELTIGRRVRSNEPLFADAANLQQVQSSLVSCLRFIRERLVHLRVLNLTATDTWTVSLPTLRLDLEDGTRIPLPISRFFTTAAIEDDGLSAAPGDTTIDGATTALPLLSPLLPPSLTEANLELICFQLEAASSPPLQSAVQWPLHLRQLKNVVIDRGDHCIADQGHDPDPVNAADAANFCDREWIRVIFNIPSLRDLHMRVVASCSLGDLVFDIGALPVHLVRVTFYGGIKFDPASFPLTLEWAREWVMARVRVITNDSETMTTTMTRTSPLALGGGVPHPLLPSNDDDDDDDDDTANVFDALQQILPPLEVASALRATPNIASIAMIRKYAAAARREATSSRELEYFVRVLQGEPSFESALSSSLSSSSLLNIVTDEVVEAIVHLDYHRLRALAGVGHI